MEVSTKSSLEAPPGSARAAVAGPRISHSPFSHHRSLQRVLDDAYARSNHRLFEELLGGILSLFGQKTEGKGD